MGDGFVARTARYVPALLFAATVFAGSVEAEWIKGDVSLNLRIGPGTNRKIIKTISTGERVTVLNRQEEWVHVQIADGRDGWIPAGFVGEEVPAVVRLTRAEGELSELRESLDGITKEVKQLRSSNKELGGRNEVLAGQNRRLETENHRLKAGARWPEWIAGATILVVGMLMGAIMHTWTARRTHSRVRL